MTHLKSVSVVLGIALAAVAQAALAQTREATFAACQRTADAAVPMRTTRDQMNESLFTLHLLPRETRYYRGEKTFPW